VDLYHIALDAMGGDHAPLEIVRGAAEALRQFSDIRLFFTGHVPTLEALLRRESVDMARISLVPATDVIEMNELPVPALRAKSDASILVAAKLVASGQAGAFVSAGNSGACVVAANLLLKRLSFIERTALAVVFPGLKKETVLLDVGAHIQTKPIHLLQSAFLGAAYARSVLGCACPQIGLLNVGEESSKGTQLVQAAYALLSEAPQLSFYGNIEGWDLPRGTVDVAVCDGFVGNLLLKLAEGIGELFIQVCHDSDIEMDQGLRKRFDYTEHGGSLVLGLNGIAVMTHGRAQSTVIFNAIGLARRTMIGKLVHDTQIFLEN